MTIHSSVQLGQGPLHCRQPLHSPSPLWVIHRFYERELPFWVKTTSTAKGMIVLKMLPVP